MINKLEAWGCNVQEALERFVDDADLYVMCLNLFMDDGSFLALGEALDSENYDAAFEAAHTLKGVAGNVSAGPLYETIETLTEKLRAQSYDGVAVDYVQLMAYKESLNTILKG